MTPPKNKPIAGYTNLYGEPLQNLIPTMYAMGKVQAGRDPVLPDGTLITDMNRLFRPGIYRISEGAANLDNAPGPTDAPAYVVHIMEDPDGYAKGGHVEDSPVNVEMTARQIRYLSSDAGTPIMTRLGVRDAVIADFIQEGVDYTVVPTVQRISTTLGSTVSGIPRYAFVKDIGIWIRYTVDSANGVIWEPAYTWGLWRPISGNDPIIKLTSNTVAIPYTHYVSYGRYSLELPDAANCEVGARVRLDQWNGNGYVFTRDSLGNVSEYKDTTPALQTVGLSDLTWHDDILLPDGTTFYKQAGSVWSTVDGSVVYVIKKATLKRTTGDIVQRFVLVDRETDVVKRACGTDIEYPIGIHVSYSPTEDTTFQAGKTYYTREVVNGVEVFTAYANAPVGTTISGTYYEKYTNARWYDVNGTTGSLKPEDITLADILAGTPTNLLLTNTDLPSNILGCTTYQFEVTYDLHDPTKKVWSLMQSSDMEAYIARINEQLGSTVNAHSERLENIEATADAIYNDMKAFKMKYMMAERHIFVRDSGGRTIFGDNAKVQGEPLLRYREGEYLPLASITDSSYIIQMFQARLTPIYHIHKHDITTQPRTLFLPTPAEVLIGKEVKLILEPFTQVMVYDNNSSTRYGYTLTGAQPLTNDPIQLVVYTFTLDRVVLPTPIDGRQYELLWTYTREVRSTKALYV